MVTVFPKNKGSVPLRDKELDRELDAGDCLEIGAYCRSVNDEPGEKEGLLCVTKLGLELRKNTRSRDNR